MCRRSGTSAGTRPSPAPAAARLRCQSAGTYSAAPAPSGCRTCTNARPPFSAKSHLAKRVELHAEMRKGGDALLVAVLARRAADLVPVREALRPRVLPRREGAELARVHVAVRVDHHAADARGEDLVPPQPREGLVAALVVGLVRAALQRRRPRLVDAVYTPTQQLAFSKRAASSNCAEHSHCGTMHLDGSRPSPGGSLDESGCVLLSGAPLTFPSASGSHLNGLTVLLPSLLSVPRSRQHAPFFKGTSAQDRAPFQNRVKLGRIRAMQGVSRSHL